MKRTLTGNDAFSKMISAELPEKTKTYTPIAHMNIVNRVRSEIRNAGFSIVGESFKCSQDGMVALGSMMINYKADPDLVLAANFVNSYNKQFAFRFSLGAVDKLTGSYLIIDDKRYGSYRRLHKGAADLLAEGKIKDIINGADEYWSDLLEIKEDFKQVHMDANAAYQFAAELFFTKTAILNTMQLNTIKSIFAKNPDLEAKGLNMFEFHNIIGEALLDAHPSEWLDNQTVLSKFLREKISIKVFSPEVEESVADVIDTSIDFLFDGTEPEESYKLPTEEEWMEATSNDVIDELP
jgi:hypothetical protein